MWQHDGRPFDDAGDWHGFVYVITRTDTGRAYVGQRKFLSRTTRPPLKGKKKRRVTVAENDWRDYWGSNEELLRERAELGESAFRREIIHLCRSKGEMNYLELREQVVRDVLLHPESFYNSYVGGRIHRRHVASLKGQPARRTSPESP